jgi:hypothetical protein
MSHHLVALSPLLSTPPRRHARNSSVAKNLQVCFDEQLPLVKRTSHPDLKRISSETVKDLE